MRYPTTLQNERVKTIMMIQWLLAWALLAQLGQSPDVDATALKQIAQKALKKVERMRNQTLSAPLKMGVKSRDQVLKFVTQRLADEYGPQKVRAEGWLLKDQGLIPEALDYGAFVTKLLTEQIAGFYDHTRQELHIADWLPAAVQEPVMAHEIFHAIQDQEWGGGKLLDSKKFGHDQILAHAALLEGDATIVMLNYSGGTDMSQSSFGINMVAASLPMQMSSGQYPTMASAPDYLKQSLIFPYQQGLLFVAALRQAKLSWDEIRAVYQDPPSSTEQILHPKKYYAKKDQPSAVKVPHDLLKGFKAEWFGATGEFHARQLLLQRLETVDAIEGASGWDGDYTVVLTKGDARVTLTHSVWDSAAEAREFARALKQTFKPTGQTKAPKTLSPVMELRDRTLVYAFSKDEALARSAIAKSFEKTSVEMR